MIPGFDGLPKYFKERALVFKYDFFNIGEYEESDFEKLTKLTIMMLKAFQDAFEEDIEVILTNFLLALEEVQNEESLETLIYYGEIYLKYIELTNDNITEEDIVKEIKKLDGKRAITISILQGREEMGIQKGIQKGMQKGIQKGIQKGNLEIAKNLLKEGTEITLIVKATGLSKLRVKKLNEELNT